MALSDWERRRRRARRTQETIPRAKVMRLLRPAERIDDPSNVTILLKHLDELFTEESSYGGWFEADMIRIIGIPVGAIQTI